MSCSLPLLGELLDVHAITRYLTEIECDDSPSEVEDADDAAEDSWEWKEQDCQEAASSPQVSKYTLNQCCISLSPAEEIMAVCKGNRAVLLTRKWSSESPTDSSHMLYEKTWSGILTESDSDKVTCVLCLPLASQQRSSQGAPDWTCIIIGFSSGYMRIYTQDGTLLIEQLLHDTDVVELKMRTKQPFASNNSWEQIDELLVLYNNALVTIDGFSLYQSLKACRNRLARSAASNIVEAVDPPPLAYRKWRIVDHKLMRNAANVGLVTPNLFDRMQKASIQQSFTSSIKQSVPAYNHFLTCGTEPFIGIYEAIEGSSPALMSDVALAVASKLTSVMFSKLTAASGWLGFSGKYSAQPEQKESKHHAKIEKGTPLSIRIQMLAIIYPTICSEFGLPDRRRQATSIQLSPIRNLAAITDNLGRVLLYDVDKAIVIRMWKGYRDASCGWLAVKETPGDESSSHHNDNNQNKQQAGKLSTALFLVIYAPRRGILEIWLTEQGNRVGAFNVGKNCRLLYPGYCILGNIFPRDYFKHSGMTPNQCYLIEEDGIIKSIHVPFHCALSNIKSISLKDAQLLRSLSSLLDKLTTDQVTQINTAKSIKSIFTSIQMPNNQIEGLQKLLSCKSMDSKSLTSYLQDISTSITKQSSTADVEGGEEDLEFEAGKHRLVDYCKSQLALIKFYDNMVKIKSLPDGPDFDPSTEKDHEELVCETLNLTKDEVSSFMASLESFQKTWRLHYQDRIFPDVNSPTMSILAFLTFFDVDFIEESNTTNQSSTSSSAKIVVKSVTEKSQQMQLGIFLFQEAVIGQISISRLLLELVSLDFKPDQLMDLLLAFIQSESGYCLMRSDHCLFLHSLVRSICSIKEGPEKDYENQKVGIVSAWWEPVRQTLSRSRAIGQCLIMAVICRTVAIELLTSAQKIKEQDEREIREDDWVAVTVDIEAWNLLVNQLEDLLALYCFIHGNHCLDQPCPLSNNYENQLKSSGSCSSLLSNSDSTSDSKLWKSVNRCSSFSVRDVLHGGYDHIAQIAASCLVRQQVPGSYLGEQKKIVLGKKRTSKSQILNESADDSPIDDDENNPQIIDGLRNLRIRFPFSLNQDLLWTNCSWECIMLWNDNLEDVSMLSCSLAHLSCIHNKTLQQGLATIVWKAVYKDHVKSIIALIEKVGKAPKERLCRKVTNMGYRSVEGFLGACQLLFEILLENEAGEIDTDDVSVGEDEIESESRPVELEVNWQSIQSRKSCLSEKCLSEPHPDRGLLRHYWSCIVVLRLIFIASLKGIKPMKLFDTKGKHALSLSLSSNVLFTRDLDDQLITSRNKFCCDVLTSLVKQNLPCLDQSVDSIVMTDPLQLSRLVFDLAPHFSVNDDSLWIHYTKQLYLAGFDAEAMQASKLVTNKSELAIELTSVAGIRLANSLLSNNAGHLSSRVVSNMPTHTTSWLQEQDVSQLYSTTISLDATLTLLRLILSYTIDETRQRKFIAELIECLDTFK